MLERRQLDLTNKSVRPYELSVWTLADEFVTVLKAQDHDYIGAIQNGKVTLSDDGTQELSFSIPMYISENGELIENPIYKQTQAKSPLLNMHKIKLIFDKDNDEIALNHLRIKIIDCFNKANGNVDLYKRPRINNSDGTYSTLLTKTYSENGIIIQATPIPKDGNNLLYTEENGEYDLTLLDNYVASLYAQQINSIQDLLNKDTRNLIIRALYYDNEDTLNDEVLWGERLHNWAEKYEELKDRGITVDKNKIDTYHRDANHVFEFMVDNVTETHMNNNVICEVKCSNLAFHELGKLGYKLVISPDEFYTAYESWFDETPGERLDNETANHYSARVAAWKQKEPVANLQYWNEQILGFKPVTESIQLSTQWYYEIRMDWSSYAYADNRKNDTVYEEAYATSWDNNLKPDAMQKEQEKQRLPDERNSNLYNLTQELAKTFGVYCKYEYEYDDNFHIIGRRVVYYNNYTSAEHGIIDISYPYSAQSIKRIIDNNDLITKLYVEDKDSDQYGNIAIADAEVNPTKEDYILNFEYLYNQGLISTEQYEQIEPFKKAIASINNEIIQYNTEISYMQDRQVELEADFTYYTNSKAEALKRITEINNRIDNIDLIDGEADGLTYQYAPRSCFLSKKDNEDFYRIHLVDKGIKFDSIEMFTEYDFQAQRLDGKVTNTNGQCSGTPIYDEYGNLIELENIVIANFDKRVVYLTYLYSPLAYYTRIRNVWSERLAADSSKLETVTTNLATIKSDLVGALSTLEELIQSQKNLRDKFAQVMGPALREGYWVPDTYTNYNVKCKEELQLPQLINVGTQGNNSYTKQLYWDTQLFDDEIDIGYYIGVNENFQYYICLDLSYNNFLASHKGELDNLSIRFYPTSDQSQYTDLNARYYSANSGCTYLTIAMRKNNEDFQSVIPVMVINGATNLTVEEREWLKDNGAIGVMTQENGQINFQKIRDIKQMILTEEDFTSNVPNTVYPRFEIDSYYLAVDSENLLLSYNNKQLKIYEDFYVLSRNTVNGIRQYITIKPKVLLSVGNFNQKFLLIYNIPTLNSSIYLDATEVAKENSQPKVSYDVQLSCLNPSLVSCAYKLLSNIVSINDIELHFEKVFGYISSLTLDLDFPDQDSIQVKNYKNKFEDLFSSIVASTAAMERSEYMTNIARNAFTNEGILKTDSIQQTLDQSDLTFSFNNGKLTIDESHGILGVSDEGLISVQSGGIFVASTKDSNNDWIMKKVISPGGINPESIMSGKLNMTDIVIQSGDNIKFQLNKDGLFAFKSYAEDEDLIRAAYATKGAAYDAILANTYQDVDTLQYVVHNSQGIFLHARSGDYVYSPTSDNPNRIIQLQTDVDRVELSWQGFIIRDWSGEKVFYADTTGNLTLKGRIYANGGKLANWLIEENKISCAPDSNPQHYVALQASDNTAFVMNQGQANETTVYPVFWAGNIDPTLAPFALMSDGTVILKRAQIEGSSSIVTQTSSTFTGVVYAQNGSYIGGQSTGLPVITRGIYTGRIGWINATEEGDVSFWAGSELISQITQTNLKNRSSIKFRIFSDGTSSIKGTTITDSTIGQGTEISIGSSGEFSVASDSGMCSIAKINLTGGNINIVKTEQQYFKVIEGSMTASNCTIDRVDIAGVRSLKLGSDTESCLDVNDHHRIMTDFLCDHEAISTIALILDTENNTKLSLNCIENSDYFNYMVTNVILNQNDHKIQWDAISTASTAQTGTENVYRGANASFTISNNKIDILKSTALGINIESSASTNKHKFLLSTNSTTLVTTLEIAGDITIFSGKVGSFSIDNGELTYSDNNSNSCLIGLNSIRYTNANNTYFSVSSTNVTVPKLTINNIGEVLSVSYRYNNATRTTALTGQEIASLKFMLGNETATENNPTGKSLRAYIENIVAQYLS